jgi:hypothetical protein
MPELILSAGATIAWIAIAGIEWLSRDSKDATGHEARDCRVFVLLAVCLVASNAVIWFTWMWR